MIFPILTWDPSAGSDPSVFLNKNEPKNQP